jgi:hypothetical protein
MFKFINQKGQALLIVILAMVVALTVGLSVVSRSVTNLRNSQQEIDSQKALSAAEAGVEQAIKSGASVGNSNFSTSTSYQTSVVTVSGGTTFLLNGNNKVSRDDAMYIWLTPYSSDSNNLFKDSDRWSGSLNLYWGNSLTACDNAALEIAVVSGSRAIPLVTRYAYDPCSPDRTSKNNFVAATSLDKSISGIALHYHATIPITNGFLVRVVPLYANSYIGAESDDPSNRPLPLQGSIITSTGTITAAGSANNNVVRKLDVFQGYPEIPAELFPFTIFWP